MIAAGVNAKALSTYMGHASIKIDASASARGGKRSSSGRQSSVTMVTVAFASAMGAPFAADSRTLNLSFLSRLRSPNTTTVNRLWRRRGLNVSSRSATKSEPAPAVPFRSSRAP